jgi:hypothetical protein
MKIEFRLKHYLGSFLLLALVAAHSIPYDHPLGHWLTREAYFIDRFAEVLGNYTKNLPALKTGPHVAEIEVARVTVTTPMET